MRLRGWHETKETGAVPTPDGPIVTKRGDFVIVLVVSSWEEAARRLLKADGR